ncbi:NUDIX hydrolase [Sunxiuqinia sp. A32]|uniref:NUDIX hydrolase n=1 Tax=Sunxiuqinia sp. A32 TaxID=3461496 RepID=UPI0040454631
MKTESLMFTEFPKHIERFLKKGLPGSRSHLKMIPPGRELSIRESDRDKIRYGSVLLLLFPYQNEIYTCLTKRNPSMNSHPGQISFPGGKIEEGESPELTALRETEEEVGISPLKVKLLGMLSELYIPASRFNIFPYVGWLEEKPEFVLNKEEAEKILLFPITESNKNKEIQEIELETVTGPLTVPYYPFEGEIIWGATAMILAEFFDLLHENQPIFR